MPNNYFQFKQFRIDQDKTSMKVCTDACIFGAWVAEKITTLHLPVAAGCLDIGSGTGLLSLMLAQKNAGMSIDAVEIEESAAHQAKENFLNSPWSDKLKIFHTDIKNFTSKKYELIISNPPFFENELSSKEENKNLAKHDKGLTLKDLVKIIKALLTSTGYFAILLPYHRVKYFENLAAENNFFLKEKILIRQTPKHNFFRGILFFSGANSSAAINESVIKDKDGNYTGEFTNLLKDYYLKL